MPRYYFHIEDDRTEVDQIGTELPDLEAARAEAVGSAGELLRNGAAAEAAAVKQFSLSEWQRKRLVLQEAGN